MRENIVGSVLIISLLFWIPGSCLFHFMVSKWFSCQLCDTLHCGNFSKNKNSYICITQKLCVYKQCPIVILLINFSISQAVYMNQMIWSSFREEWSYWVVAPSPFKSVIFQSQYKDDCHASRTLTTMVW